MAIDPLTIDPKALLGASRADLVALAKNISKAKQNAVKIGPQNDDELHAYIVEKWGISVPRVAVTPGMDPPFAMIADVFFMRENAVLGVACREGSKTMGVAIIHALLARFYPGYEGISAGAIDEQSKRAYQALMTLLRRHGADWVKGQSLQSKTDFTNGSIVEVKGGTMAQLNGPHSNLLHRDEIELFNREAFNEADNITKSATLPDGRQIPAIDILTTSRKRARGLLQEIMDDCEVAIKAGRKPPYKIYKWGVAETIKRVPNCRGLPENEGKPDSELCPCHNIVKGTWDDDSERTLESVCDGRFGRSDGWRPLEPDIIKKFTTNSRAMWDAQQECIKPATEGLILTQFSEERCGIRDFEPDPENGKIYNASDFGGANPHSSHWYQRLDRPYESVDFWGQKFVIPVGSLVCFDEVYIAEVGNNTFARMIVAKEEKWKALYPGWQVEERYADVANRAARIDFRNHETPLPTMWRVTREIEEHIQKCNDIINEKRFYVLLDGCPMFVDEAKSWQRDPATGKQIDTFNHCLPAGTMVATPTGEVPIEQVGKGDVVSTVCGDREVLAAGITQFDADVYEISFDDGSSLRATANHPCWVEGKGWVNVSDIRYADRLWKLLQHHSSEEKQSSSSFAESGSAATQMRKTNRHGCTTDRGFKKRISASNRSIVRFGRLLTEKFRLAARFTTQTSIRSTTTSAIYCVSLLRNIVKSTEDSRAAIGGNGTLIECAQTDLLPISLTLEFELEHCAGTNDFMMRSKPILQLASANSAAESSQMLRFTEEQSSVATPASQRIAARRESTTRNEPALCAELNSPSTDIQRSDHALVSVVSISLVSNEDVYDLTIDGAHEFYANGIRVHNSMSDFRYAVANVERKLQIESKRKGSLSGDSVATKDNTSTSDPLVGMQDVRKLPDTGPASRSYDDGEPFDIPLHQQGESDGPGKIW